MKRGEHGEIGGPVFEHVIEVPDFEMVAHADKQCALRDTALRAHPRRNRNAALAIEPCRRHEAVGAAACGLVRLDIVAALAFALAPVAFGDACTVIHDHAGRFVMQPYEEVIVCRARLDCDAEGIVKRHVTANADTRQRAADKEIVHNFLSIESNDDAPKAASSLR